MCLLIAIGSQNLTDYEEVGDEQWVATGWFYHAGFQPGPGGGNLANDIAVVYLGGASAFAPVAVDRGTRGAAAVGKAVLALGFGTTWASRASESTDYAPTSAVLQRVRLGVTDPGWCDDRAYYSARAQICAGALRGGVDTCQGDSGGPLLALQEGSGVATMAQVGLVSYGYGCAQPYAPGIYTRLSAHIRWLQRAVPDLPPAAASDFPAAQALEPAAGSVVCGAEAFGQSLWLDCGALPIGRIVSAVWGRTGYGVCAPPEGATPAALDADAASTVACCVGVTSCAAPVSEAHFGAVPGGQFGTLRNNGVLSVYVQAICGEEASWPALPPPPPQPPAPRPPPRRRAASPPPPVARSTV
jgi:hypothetical protein